MVLLDASPYFCYFQFCGQSSVFCAEDLIHLTFKLLSQITALLEKCSLLLFIRNINVILVIVPFLFGVLICVNGRNKILLLQVLLFDFTSVVPMAMLRVFTVSLTKPGYVATALF